RLPDALDRNSDFWYSATITQSTNAVIQGSAAIQTKATMVEMDKLCKRKTAEGKGEWRILAPIHDELIIDVPDTITEADVQDFVDVMVETYKFGDVPNKQMSSCTDDGVCQSRWMNGLIKRRHHNGTNWG